MLRATVCVGRFVGIAITFASWRPAAVAMPPLPQRRPSVRASRGRRPNWPRRRHPQMWLDPSLLLVAYVSCGL